MSTVLTSKGTPLPLISLKGKQYLQVSHRLVWFREEKPEWSLENDYLEINEKYAIARCIVKNDQGRIIAVAHKREDLKDFNDYIEKAQTSAIGRALALCGYGTQFTEDLEEGERLADAPVDRRPKPTPSAVSNKPTEQDRKALTELAFANNWSREWVLGELKRRYNVATTAELTKEQFNEFQELIRNNPQAKKEETK